jgi:transglutaminase-like putative cysteine protease
MMVVPDYLSPHLNRSALLIIDVQQDFIDGALTPAGRGIRLEAGPTTDYLGADAVINWHHPAVATLGRQLRDRHPDDADFARAAFEWVRDRIAHNADAGDPRVTCAASQVLGAGVGLCYAKSHLLVALLRGQGIPAGLCYQRLRGDQGWVVHGLVALYLDGAWHRQDPRGNRSDIDAQFCLTGERLAWPADTAAGEYDYPRLYASPAPEVLDTLARADNVLTCQLPSDLH